MTGRPRVIVDFREVWADQVDNFGEPCQHCQLVGKTIEATVYVPTATGREVQESCMCCVVDAVLNTEKHDPSRDVLVEYSKGLRR
jgi:hypothetical protein